MKVGPRLLPVLSVLAFLTSAARAQRELKVIPDPDPEIERRSFQVADGFEVNLYAADSLLAKPIQMNFDPAGRLWVATSAVYPQIKPGQPAEDKIVILEDTKGAGRADKVTVFAEGLFIPTGIAPGDGGAYVANSTEMIHLTEKNGRAVSRRVVLTGFGTEDTHHILHTFRWGPDGMLYFNQSIYIHSHIETPYGVRRLNGGGVWQFRPETMQLEVFAHGFCNPWGHAFDRWGQSFVTDGAYGEGINYLLPGASYVFTPGAVRLVAGLNPGSPKHCGEEILSGRHLPEDWRGNILTNDFRGHRVCRFVISEEGAAYASREKPELIKTNHAAFRPIDVKMGPDGAIYIADWYNPIIQHGEVDFRDPRRDHVHGRIWRVTAKGRPPAPRPNLAGASTEELLEALKAPEDWTRNQAKRVLKERGKSVLPVLASWTARLDPNDPAFEHNLLEALWTYQSLNVVNRELLLQLLHARDHHARAAAVRVLDQWHDRVPEASDWFSERVADEHPQVRLEAVRGLAHLQTAPAAKLALKALDKPVDKYLDYAIWLTVRELAPYWMAAVKQGAAVLGDNVRHLVYALEAVGTSESIRPLLELVSAGRLSRQDEDSVLELAARLGGSKELPYVWQAALESKDAAGRTRLLRALVQAARRRGVKPDGDLGRLAQFFGETNPESARIAAMQLAGLWHIEPLRQRLAEAARATNTAESVRRAAMEGLAALGGSQSRQLLAELASPSQPSHIREMAIVSLAAIDLRAAAGPAADFLASAKQSDAGLIFETFLGRKDGAPILAAALAGHNLPADVARTGIRAVRGMGRDLPQLVEAITKAGGLKAGPRILSALEMRHLVTEVLIHGNAAHGEEVFRRKDLLCLKCHALGGAGGQVGPDLSSVGASAQVDYLVESILQPNKAVKENYHSMVVTTKEGRFFTGIKVRETNTDLVLRDAEDREVAVPLSAIEDKAMGGSLMPDGLADTLTRTELVDLVRFLSELGKVGPYSISKSRLVRRWQALEPNHAAYSLIDRTRVASVAASDANLIWTPAYSTVSGSLPVDAMPSFIFHKSESNSTDHYGFVRCHMEATTPGKAVVSLNSSKGLQMWVDGEPIGPAAQVILDLTAAIHTLTFAINLDERREPLRCELADSPTATARVQIVGGK
jgi:putative heme-binding domain-containing protein